MNTARPRVADALVRMLIHAGIDSAFGIPGLHTLTLYDAIVDAPRIRHVTVRHEASAVYAADGFYRVSGRPAAVLATTGVATFNTLGALSEADLDGSPVLLLAGQIPSALIGRGRGILHETDDQAAAFVSACGVIERPRTAVGVLESTARALSSLRVAGARPAYVELPFDLMDLPAPEAIPEADHGPASAVEPPSPAEADVRAIVALIAAAVRPVILAGGGVVRERATAELASLARCLASPVLHSVPGRGAIPIGHPLDAGPLVPGHGLGPALLAESDLVIVVGERLDAQTTGGWTLRMGDRLVHLTDRAAHLDRGYPPAASIAGPVRASMRAILARLGERAATSDQASGAAIEAATERARDSREALRASLAADRAPVLRALDALHAGSPEDTIVTSDAAAINSWTAFFWPACGPGTFLFPWGSAALGFALPAGIGASLAAPGRPVLVTCGDGGFQFTLAELATAAQIGANLTVVVADDGAYGSIAAYQEQRHGRTMGTELRNPDFVALAAAYGIPAVRVERIGDLAAAANAGLASAGPSLIHLTAPVPQPW